MCCHRSNNSTVGVSNQIDSIYITYFCGAFETFTAIRCENLAAIQKKHPKNDYSHPLGPELIDTCIVNKDILNKIKELLGSKTPAPDYSEDARMFITIKKKNGHKDYICINQWSNPVKYNGRAYLVDNEILFLLRYYSGYYLWFKSSYYNWFEELQDSVSYQKVIRQKVLSL
jgi:hypothetical protein